MTTSHSAMLTGLQDNFTFIIYLLNDPYSPKFMLTFPMSSKVFAVHPQGHHLWIPPAMLFSMHADGKAIAHVPQQWTASP